MGEQGSEDDRRWLTLYNAAVDALTRSQGTKLPYDGIGFAFLPDDGLVGIDLDNMVDLDTGEIQPRAIDIIKACGSYTERSPSRKGFHIFVRGDTAVLFDGKRQSFKNNAIGVEVFCGSQYFTFTGDHVGTSPAEVNEIDIKVLKRLHTTVAQARSKGKAAGQAPALTGNDQPAGQSGADQPAPAAPTPPTPPNNDFKRVNDAAMANLDAWVPALFPAAERSSFGWRVSSAALGRDLEEDISFASSGDKVGIVDYGVNDMGDPREGKRTPIDIVIEWSPHKKPVEALKYLAGRLGITLAARPSRSSTPRPGKGGAAGSPPAKPGGKGGGDNRPGEPPMDGEGNGVGGTEDGMPLIKWRQGFLRECVDAAEAALIDSTDRLFQRGDTLVRVVRRDSANVRNYRRDPGMLGFQVVDQGYLVEAMTAAAIWRKFDSRAGKWVRTNAPDKAAATYLSRVGRWRLPRLWSVIAAPTLRPDGTVLQAPGYDEATATWYDPGRVEFPVVPDSPSREDARHALDLLRETFSTFPFCTPADESVFLAMLLTALVRRSIAHAPLGGFTAPTSSSGKTLLADLVSIVATGIRAPAITYAQSDEEAQKLALSALMQGDPLILLDNVQRPIEGDWLCTILTSEVYRGRLLGKNEMISVPSTSVWLATGNNLVFAGDLRTRSLVCRIDAQTEHPEHREFTEDAKETVARIRPELVAAGLTVMRAFIAQGERVSRHIKPWGRFEQWSAMVRAPLVWLGCADPCDTVASLEKDDPERGDLLQMLTAWREAFTGEPATVRAAVNLATETPALRSTAGNLLHEALRDIAKDRDGTINVKRASKWIGRHIGRRAEGMQFVKDKEHDHVLTYRVERIDDTATAKKGPTTQT